MKKKTRFGVEKYKNGKHKITAYFFSERDMNMYFEENTAAGYECKRFVADENNNVVSYID